MTSAAPTSAGSRAAKPAGGQGIRRWWADRFTVVIAVLVLAYLLLPIGYVLAFSFNDYRRSNIAWNPDGSPTLKHWANPCGAPGVCESLVTSLQIAAVSTLIATAIGTMLAMALVRYRMRGRSLLTMLVFVPMATPEIVLGASLLTIFVQGYGRAGINLGWWTIVAAHVMFCLSFVVITVRARLLSLDPRVEEAAADLYAGPGQTFWRVTLPMVAPGVVAAALLSFALSFDDFIITNFVSGEVTTFPKYVYASYLRGIPAQVNVIGSAMLLVAVSAVVGWLLLSRARGARAASRR